MVRSLHEAGLEVVLDVVYNHTAEAGPDGPTLCFRGLDNAAYYRLDPQDRARYVDTTGCGNALDAGSSVFLRLMMDSLRYWVGVMGVDGFRFDLAATLARQDGSFDDASAFFDLVDQDPLLSQAYLVAEPWDVGQGDSYDVGRFPARWSEWNGRFRDTVRDFWRSHDGMLGDLAARLTGSADLYSHSHRGPTASVNLVTVHDGFTLRDLVSYDRKHNEDNGEDNRDGTDDNRSWNCGVEGPTTDPEILELRARQIRAMLATLLLSAGVPLLLGGDELGRSQQGNNNAYCQDNEIAWLDRSNADADLNAFVTDLIAFRRRHPVLQRRDVRPAPRCPRLVHTGRRRDDRRGVGRPVRQGDRPAPRRNGRAGGGGRRLDAHRRRRRPADQRLVGTGDLHAALGRRLLAGRPRHLRPGIGPSPGGRDGRGRTPLDGGPHIDISASRSARMSRLAASMRARCENACGKLPRCRAVSTSNSSA